MTINGPAPAMLAFFMNAPPSTSNVNCTSGIMAGKGSGRKLKAAWDKPGRPRPLYNSMLGRRRNRKRFPKGNNGLGLMLLGITGDQVIPLEEYETHQGGKPSVRYAEPSRPTS